MARITDGTRSIDIYMGYWLGDQYSPDFSGDFFEVSSLPMDANDFFIVPDVGYCIKMAEDWCDGRGDYSCDADDDPHFDDRTIGIDPNP